MNKQPEITDDEFVPFLHSIGVDTYNKSFEWMLDDPKFTGVLTWMYKNLNHNNALTPREEYRYRELEKRNLLLPSEELESNLASIQLEYPGICVPGDLEAIEDIKSDINMQKERLAALEKQEKIIKALVAQNEQVNEQLTIEVTKLNSAQHQLAEEEQVAGKECLRLAAEVDDLTDGVIDVVSRALDVYASCHLDKELSNKFFLFGPLEAYSQSQALFRAHFDLYTARHFDKPRSGSYTDSLVEAKSLEDRLSEAALAYIKTKADLSGKQAEVALLSSDNNVHPTQIASMVVEAQTAIELLHQEEVILQQKVESGVQHLVARRSQQALNSATSAALAHRQQVLSSLTHLVSTCEAAACVDWVWERCARAGGRAAARGAHFAAQLAEHARGEAAPAAHRIESMNEIISQQEACTLGKQSDVLLQSLNSILGAQNIADGNELAKIYADLQEKVKDLKGDVEEAYRKKEEFVAEIKNSSEPIRSYAFNGSTEQAASGDGELSSLSHALRRRLCEQDRCASGLGALLATHKNGDKQNLRKLWQWFLTDPPRLLAAVKGIQASYYKEGTSS